MAVVEVVDLVNEQHWDLVEQVVVVLRLPVLLMHAVGTTILVIGMIMQLACVEIMVL